MEGDVSSVGSGYMEPRSSLINATVALAFLGVGFGMGHKVKVFCGNAVPAERRLI